MYTGTGANRLVPAWELNAKVAFMVTFAAALAVTVVYMFVWIPSAFMGRLAERGGVTIRVLPALALLAVVATGGTAMLLLSSEDIEFLGRPSPLLWFLYGLSLSIPVLAGIALLRAAIGSTSAGRFTRGLALVDALLATGAAAYLHQYGWIGLKIWE
jgi:hypothetical protein